MVDMGVVVMGEVLEDDALILIFFHSPLGGGLG